jgi:hypothetical protein
MFAMDCRHRVASSDAAKAVLNRLFCLIDGDLDPQETTSSSSSGASPGTTF